MNENFHLTLWLCLNVLIMASIILIIGVFSSSDFDYFNFGYNEKLWIIGMKVDTFGKYCIILLGIFLLRLSEVMIVDVFVPIVNFSIYRPDKLEIKRFTKRQLIFFNTAFYFLSALRVVLLIFFSISQIDIALFTVISSTVIKFVFSLFLLSKKKFIESDDEREFSLLP